MALSRDVYRELEDIVGPENISEDLAVLDGYAFQRVGGLTLGDPYFLRPEAVVLPGSTEEVQAIIKLCNRRGIRSIASSTCYGPSNTPGSEGAINLDLRRMNRILDIDEKNMYIVVEPYVTFAQVQAEAQKRGLNCLVIGAGSNCSFLASHTAAWGNNSQAISHGYSGRNLLGVEWVLPTGELLRIGSLGAGAGWFSGDGPGPSLRGILRGSCGSLGGLGVFTKCACHLQPWPGPQTMEIKGISPDYETVVPPLFEYHMIDFPSWEKCADAQYKIGEAGIAYVLHVTGGPGSHGASVSGSNNAYYEKWEELKQIPEISLAIVMAGNSPGEHEYQVKTLDKILEDTGGRITPLGEEPIMKNRDYIDMVKGCFIPRTAFRMAGVFGVDGIVGQETVDNCALGLNLDGRQRDKYVEKGVIVNDGTYNSWGSTFEGAHLALVECGQLFSATDKESAEGMEEMRLEGLQISLKTPLGLSWSVRGDEVSKVVGPACGNFQNWMRKIKKVFDPNTASETVCYISAEEE